MDLESTNVNYDGKIFNLNMYKYNSLIIFFYKITKYFFFRSFAILDHYTINKIILVQKPFTFVMRRY